MYFTVERFETKEDKRKKKPYDIQRSKISLFGRFDHDLRFRLKEAGRKNVRLKGRIKDFFELIKETSTPATLRKLEAAMSCHAERDPLNPPPNDTLNQTKPRGWLYVFHTYWLGNFVAKKDWRHLDALIKFYSEEFQACPNDHGFIDATSWEELLHNDGHALSIFRQKLYKSHIDANTILQNHGENGDEETETRPDRRWLEPKTYLRRFDLKRTSRGNPDYHDHIDFYFRLAGTGIIEVREESRFRNDTTRQFLEALLRFRSPVSPPDDEEEGGAGINRIGESKIRHTKDQVKDFVTILLESFNECRKNAGDKIGPATITVNRERQRYTVIMMSRLEAPDGASISPETLSTKKPELIRNFLEGTMVYQRDSRRGLESPAVPKEVSDQIGNNSTWSNELCVFGSDRCLIFFEPRTLLETEGRVFNYEDYWKCIVRGIEHTVSVRTALLLRESYSKSRLEKIPEIVHEFGKYEKEPSKGMSRDLQEKLQDLTVTVANILGVLPLLRQVSVAPTAFLSGHAVDKFDYLNEKVFRFSDILGHVQQNIDEMSDFLQFFEQQQLTLEIHRGKEREARTATYLAVMGLLLALLASFYTAPIFLDAFHKICGANGVPKCLGQAEVHSHALQFLYALLIVHTTGLLLYIAVTWKQRSKWKLLGLIFAGVLWILLLFALGWLLGADTDGNWNPYRLPNTHEVEPPI